MQESRTTSRTSSKAGRCRQRALVTFTARDRVIPVPADSVQACEWGLAEKRIARLTLEPDGHAHAKIRAHHLAVSEGPRIRAALKLVGWRANGNARISAEFLPRQLILPESQLLLILNPKWVTFSVHYITNTLLNSVYVSLVIRVCVYALQWLDYMS